MNNNYVKIKDHANLVKDLRSSAVVSNDNVAYQAALRTKKRYSEINDMKKDISDLKNMVELLINKLDK